MNTTSPSADRPDAPQNCCKELLARSADLRAAGLLDEALNALDGCDPPQSAPLLAARARLLNETGRFAEAATAAKLAVEADSTSADARFALGFSLYMLERLPEAAIALDELLALEPAYPNAAWMRAGLIRRVSGDLVPEALAAYDFTLTVDPDNLYVRVERADILRAIGRYEEALAAYSAVVSSCDDEPLRIEATFKRGCVYLVLNDTPAALAAFRTVLDAAPDYPDAREMVELLSTPQ